MTFEEHKEYQRSKADARKLTKKETQELSERTKIKRFEEYEKSTKEKEKINFSKNNKDKQFDKRWVEIIIEDNQKFENYYTTLYDKLIKRFQIEFKGINSLENKCNFLQELIDAIFKANHDMKHNFNISELAEESEKELMGLIKFFDNEMKKLMPEKRRINKEEKDKLWFKAGMCFAQGKMDKYQFNGAMKNDYTAPKIAKELNLLKCEKYFLATLNNYDSRNPNSSKNIFNSVYKVEAIIKHCKENEIKIATSFLNRYNEIKKNTN